MSEIQVPLVNETKSKKAELMNWTLYISLFLSLIATLISVAGYFKKPVITDSILYSFPKSKVEGVLKPGQIVSLTKEGNVRLGAGTTIAKNVYSWPNESMSHLHSTAVGQNIIVSAYDGYVMLTYVDENDVVLFNTKVDIPKVGDRKMFPDDLITLDEKTVVVMGNSHLLPATVTWKNDHVVLEWGAAVPFLDGQTFQPEMDSLNSTCVALSYYVGFEDIKIGTRVGCIRGSGKDLQFEFYAENLYSKNFVFHGIAGLKSDTYILAKAGSENGEDKTIHFQLATVLPDGSVSIPKGDGWKLQRSNFGFFDIDNLNDHQAIVTFIDGDLSDGIMSVLLTLDARRKLHIGPTLDHQDGGASGMSESGVYNFIYIRVMSESHFAVFYSNLMAEGATAVSIAEVTPANDLIAVGPEYIVSSKMTDADNQYYWLGECSPHTNRLVLTECLVDKVGSDGHAEMHVIDIMPLPLGVVVSATDDQVDVAISGTISVTNTLEVGRNYYSDNKGMMVKGEYAGLINTESFYVYVENDDDILSDDNRIGMAIDTHTLFINRVNI